MAGNRIWKPGQVLKARRKQEEYLKEHQTDVLVTDIRMRGMSGIELIEAVRNAGVNMEIVVISGYRDFDYAQQVMKMRVRHYLVKPMKYAQIMEVFTEIRQEHGREKRRAEPGRG